MHKRTHHRVFTVVWALLFATLLVSSVNAQETDPYMGASVTLGKAPNGAIANQKLLDGIEKVGWLKPTIEEPAEGIWVFGGYGLAPIAVIDTEEGLIAIDTGDSKHDGELLLKAIRTVSKKPVKAIIYGHSHTVLGAGVLTEGNDKDVMVIGHPGLNEVVEANLQGGGAPAFYPELGPYLTGRGVIQFNAYMPEEGPDAFAGSAHCRKECQLTYWSSKVILLRTSQTRGMSSTSSFGAN